MAILWIQLWPLQINNGEATKSMPQTKQDIQQETNGEWGITHYYYYYYYYCYYYYYYCYYY